MAVMRTFFIRAPPFSIVSQEKHFVNLSLPPPPAIIIKRVWDADSIFLRQAVRPLPGGSDGPGIPDAVGKPCIDNADPCDWGIGIRFDSIDFTEAGHPGFSEKYT